MRIGCETCDQDGTGSWGVHTGRPTVCCDDCNPANGKAEDLPVGFWYIRWHPLPKDVDETFLLPYVSQEVLAKAFAR